MRTGRYTTSRQKACQHCSEAKAKCDLQPDRCGRCALRGLECTYPRRHSRTPAASPNSERDSSMTSADTTRVPLPGSSSFLLQTDLDMRTPATPVRTTTLAFTPPDDGIHPAAASSTTPATSTPASASVTAHPLGHHAGIDGDVAVTASIEVELCCPINADHISSRWLNPYVPIPGQEVKEYPANIKEFIPRILASYASVAVRGRGVPPFVHPAQLQPSLARPPLSTCLSLVRICERLLPGSDGAAADVLQREMATLYEQHTAMDDAATLLSAFQAHLLYSMVLFFRLASSHHAGQSLRQAMMDLQNLASLCCRRGVVCVAEQKRARPGWESWILAEAKRRTLYTMYLFDSVLSTQEGVPTFFGTELQGLPAPAGGQLWEARTRRDWEAAYNTHLADWVEGGLRIDELWPAHPWLDESEVAERRHRVDRWLDEVDGFGTMLYVVSSSSHTS